MIDLINGINSDKITARVAADFYDMGFATGKYLTALQSDKKAAKVAWFPGPAGAAWVAGGDKGFRTALNGSSLSVIDGGFGDTGIAAQATSGRSPCWTVTRTSTLSSGQRFG